MATGKMKWLNDGINKGTVTYEIYKVVFTIIFVAMGLDVVNKFEFLKSISPINYSDYWFMS